MIWSLLLAWYFVLPAAQTGCGKNDGEKPPIVTPADTSFTNPLLSSGPDPWVVQKDSVYYYTHTLGNRIAIWYTTDITNLKNAPSKTIWTAPVSGPDSKNVWAPEIHVLDGKWYAYYAADDGNNANHRMYVLENASANPTDGAWLSKGKIADSNDKWAIDGTVMEYGGKQYFLWSGWEGNTDGQQNIYIALMSNPWKISGSRVKISTPEFDWETQGSPDVNEGPEALVGSTGRMFVTYSAGGCWSDDYALGLLSLKAGGDPLNAADWSKSPTPVFTKNTGGNAFGPGHNSFFKSPDGKEDWILYHANSFSGQGCGNNRNPRAQKFSWNADGTPNFGTPVAAGAAIKKPSSN